MSGWARFVATLIVVVLVGCGQATAPTDLVEAPLQPSGADNRPRLALVIGIEDYSDEIGKLENPVADAELVARSLQSVGFELAVPVVRNATREQLGDALHAFESALEAAGDDAIGLIYFAGHGVQVNGANYLLPRDARQPTDLPADASRLRRALSRAFLPADDLLAVLGSRAGGASILILDACRNNPLTRSIQLTRSAGSEAELGLSDMGLTTGVLIAYATMPNEVAQDGGDSGNSPYARALAAEMLRGGTVYEVFNRVRSRVWDATGGRQNPLETNGLLGSSAFCFGPCAVGGDGGAVISVVSCEQAQTDWEAISTETSITLLSAFLNSVPENCGLMRGRAQSRLDEVNRAAEVAFQQAIAQRRRSTYQTFLTTYAGHAREAEVRTRLGACRMQTFQEDSEDTDYINSITRDDVYGDTQASRDACLAEMLRECRIEGRRNIRFEDRHDYEFSRYGDSTRRENRGFMMCRGECTFEFTSTSSREVCD